MRPARIEADHAGADAEEHRLDEQPAGFGVDVGRPERRLLFAEDPVIRLKAREKTAISSGSFACPPAPSRSPAATRPAACTSRATGAAMLVAAAMPNQTAPTSTSSTVSR